MNQVEGYSQKQGRKIMIVGLVMMSLLMCQCIFKNSDPVERIETESIELSHIDTLQVGEAVYKEDTVLTSQKDSVLLFLFKLYEYSVDSVFIKTIVIKEGDFDSTYSEEILVKTNFTLTDTLQQSRKPVNQIESIRDTLKIYREKHDTTLNFLDNVLAIHTQSITENRISLLETHIVGTGTDSSNTFRSYEESSVFDTSESQKEIPLISWKKDSLSRTDTTFQKILEEVSTSKTTGYQITTRRFRKIMDIVSGDIYQLVFEENVDSYDENWNPVSLLDTIELDYLYPLSTATDTSFFTESDSIALNAKNLFIVESDYFSGQYGALNLLSQKMTDNVAPIHSDAFAKYFSGDFIYLVNRMPRDNIQVIDKNSLLTEYQFPVTSGTNPVDLFLHRGKLLVLAYEKNTLEFYDQFSGVLEKTLNFDEYADDDGSSEPGGGYILNDKIYIILQRMDRSGTWWSPLTGKLISIDLFSNERKSIDLPFKNPQEIILNEGLFYISANGNYGELDGGVITFNPEQFIIQDTLVTEDEVGGEILEFNLTGKKLWLGVTQSDQDAVIRFDMDSQKQDTVMSTYQYSLGGIVMDSADQMVYIGDRVLGIRKFSESGTEISLKGSTAIPVTGMVLVK